MKGKKVWRLSKTLARPVEVRPIEQEDVKFAWAAYKMGHLKSMGFTENLDASKFKEVFEVYVLTNIHAAWTVLAHGRKGYMPVGFVLGEWGPHALFMFIVGIVWFPWATQRNIVEGTVQFFDRLRKQMHWMGFAGDQHKPLYEACCAHGIMRRIGTSHQSGQPVAVYEARPQ